MSIRTQRTRAAHRLRALAVAMCVCMAATPAVRAQTPPGSTSDARGGARDLYLEVDLNGQRTATIAHFREVNGHLMANGKDLDDLGLATDRLGIAATDEVRLDAIPGLRYRYDAAQQSVDLELPDSIRKPYRFDTRQLAATPAATSSRGFLLNYDLFAQTGTAEQAALYNEARYFDPAGVFSSTGIGYLYRNLDRYVRYDTSWTMSNESRLTTQQYGDLVTSSLAWSRSIRIAGFQWRSNFALRPDLVTFPVAALSGTAVVPSSVDLYINSVRQYSGSVPSGPFVVNDVPGITGAGQATVVTRDALGRTITTSVPLYVDPRLLTAGLSSWSFEAGFLRRNYGIDSFDYDPRPALSGSVRYGVTNQLTLEGHAEATGGLVNAGGGALYRLGMAGVVNGALSASAGVLSGTQLSLGYQFVQPRFSIDAQTVRTFGNYGDLGARDGTPVPGATDRVTLALPVFRNQTFSLSYIGFRYPQTPPSAIGSVAWTFSLGNLTSVNLSAFQDFKQHDSRGVFIALNIGLGHDTSLDATVGRQNGESSYNVNVIRPPDYGGGWGYGVQAGNSGMQAFQQAQLQYLGNVGEVTAVAQRIGGTTSASVDLSGAVVLMDHAIEPSRRIDDGFALVSTDGVAGIPVLHENRVMGVTDSGGHLLIPDLNSYQHNQVSIDSLNLPADARIASTAQDLVPQAQSGVLAHFGVTRYSGASVILRDADGKVLAPGSRVRDVETGKDTIVGYDGLTFIDDLQDDNHLRIDSDGRECTVEFRYSRPANGALPTLGPFTCQAEHEAPAGAVR